MSGNNNCTYYVTESVNGCRLDCTARTSTADLGIAIVTISGKTLTISMWCVNKEYRHTGIGKELLKCLIKKAYEKMGSIEEVLYNWNGTNSYVLDWMERHFNAMCIEDIASMKYDCSDSKKSHVYRLNPEAVLRYFEVR